MKVGKSIGTLGKVLCPGQQSSRRRGFINKYPSKELKFSSSSKEAESRSDGTGSNGGLKTFIHQATNKGHDAKSSHSNKHQQYRHNRPMVHLSSAPKVKFTGKKIGTSHPIVPHPTTPQRRIVQTHNNDINNNKSSSAATTMNLSLPSYALNGVVANGPNPEGEEGIVTVHISETINKIRKASQLAADMLHQACEVAQQKPFMTTDEIDRIIHCSILNHKITTDDDKVLHAYPSPLNYNHFPKSICCSVNEVICHGIPDLRRLEHGDLLSIDISVFLDGVHGDNCASIIIGGQEEEEQDTLDDELLEQKERARRLIYATEEAMYTAINVCHHGTPLNEIGNAVHDVAEKYGYRSMKHVCGHGIGQRLHMTPQIKHFRNNDDNIKLQAGMVITIEPALVEGHHAYTTWGDGWSKCTVDGGLSAQFEHTILIKDEGYPEILTRMSKFDET